MAKFCSKCGQPVSEGAKFCTHCGFDLSTIVQPANGPSAAKEAAASLAPSIAPETVPSTTRAAQRKKVTIKKRVYIPIIAVLIVLVALYYTGKALTSPERIVDAFKNAVRDHKVHELA